MDSPDPIEASPSLHSEMEEESRSPVVCPRCGQMWGPSSRACPSCNMEAAEISLHDPKHFALVSFFLTGFIPLWMTARNFRQVGRKKDARRILAFGCGGFLLIFSFLAWMPAEMDALGRIIGMAGNLGLGFALRENQTSLYRTWREKGSRKAGWAGQAGLAILVLVLILVTSLVPPFLYLDHCLQEGYTLLADGRFDEAREQFWNTLRLFGDDPDALYGMSYASAGRGEWAPAVEYGYKAVHEMPENAQALAILGLALRERGDGEEAQKFLHRAERQVPGIVGAAESALGMTP